MSLLLQRSLISTSISKVDFLNRMAAYLPPLIVQNILEKIVATNVWSLSNKNILIHFHQEKKIIQEELFAIKFQPLSVYTSMTELFKYFL